MGGEQVAVKTALASLTLRKVRTIEGARPQRITEYHIYLDDFGAKKIRWRSAEGLAFGAILVAGAAAQVDVLPGSAVLVLAVGAAQVVDGLAGKGFRGEAGAGDYDLAVFIAISGVGGLETGHGSISAYCGAAEVFCWSHRVSSASEMSPDASARKTR